MILQLLIAEMVGTDKLSRDVREHGRDIRGMKARLMTMDARLETIDNRLNNIDALDVKMSLFGYRENLRE